MDYTKYLNSIDNQVIRSEEPLPKNMFNIWTIYGARGSGKSNLLLNALRHKIFFKNYYNNIYLFSPTAMNDAKFKDLVDELEEDNKLFTDCDEETIKEIIEKIKGYNEENKNAKNLIIFDDCIHMLPRSTQKSVIHELITTNRHLRTTIIITSQRFKNISTLIRANADIISFFKTNNTMEKKLFCDEYSINEEVLEAITENNHDFMHITFTSGKPLFFDKFTKINI